MKSKKYTERSGMVLSVFVTWDGKRWRTDYEWFRDHQNKTLRLLLVSGVMNELRKLLNKTYRTWRDDKPLINERDGE